MSLAILGTVVFLIGEERKMFSNHQTLKAAFKDVKGLSRGSPVRMGGVDIGTVSTIAFAENEKDDTIYVNMSVVRSQARRIREDSVAEVKDKGLLGDKMIVISVGSEGLKPLKPNALVKTEESSDIEQILDNLKDTAQGAEKVMSNLERTTDAFAQEDFHQDIQKTVAHLSSIMEAVDEGEGYIPKLLKDEGESARLSQTVTELQSSAVELRRLLASARMVADQVREGPGFAHEVLYGESGSTALTKVGGAADELRLALEGVRQGDSLVHDVLYEESSKEMVSNLNRVVADLSAIVADVRKGKGTLGAFLSDPSVYEDIKVLLGNVGRNRSLRALVRYSIKQDEEKHRIRPGEESANSGSLGSESSPSGGGAPFGEVGQPDKSNPPGAVAPGSDAVGGGLGTVSSN